MNFKDNPLVVGGLNTVRRWRETRRLRRVPRVQCPTEALASIDESRVRSILADPGIAAEWPAIATELATLGITEEAHGVNPGDRRALYYLVRATRPARVLEIGTHIGASTVHIAAALRATARDGSAPLRLTTVDILPVNDPTARLWERYGSRHSPATMVQRLGVGDIVEFKTAPAEAFLAAAPGKYDFIFLDGDHAAAAVYRELSTASAKLAPGGLIVLHDYFPGGQPLWPGSPVIPGPWLATERLVAEGAKLRVLPLGDLPWPTKLGGNTTSLAVVAKAT
ncbi:MAG TPA: class I SAM-dependent methyltransferase [Vicinamibacteria bacterium]|nr:class I SAM-dependent methyltransferase [Vicinamibacteria bacterium]